MKLEVFKYKIRKKIYEFLDNTVIHHFQKLFFKPIRSDILIFDDFFPCPLSNFRYIEFNEYLKNYNTLVFTTGKSLKYVHLFDSIRKFIKIHPERNRIRLFWKDIPIEGKLAILVFQHNAVNFLDFLENNKIPFIFTLYPGGNFRLYNNQGDKELKKIFQSIYFRKVIVTQKITKQYLIENKLCKSENIEFIYGCPVEINQNDNFKVKQSRELINICFVAAKYHPTGMDKGYDIFIDVAKLLCKSSTKFRFHIVGGFNEFDIDTNEIRDYVCYYGYLDMDELKKFYENMDFILSPNRSNILSSGAFDGFPTASVVEAGLKGVIMMFTDDFNQNIYFQNNIDCIFVDHNAYNIYKKIIEISGNTELMHTLSVNGQNLLLNLFSYENQIKKRFEIIDTLIKEK